MLINSASCGALFDVNSKKRRLDEILSLESQPEFWTNQTLARTIGREKVSLETELTQLANLERNLADALALRELIQELTPDDPTRLEFQHEAQSVESALQAQLEGLEFRKLLGREMDDRNAIVTINAGAGGTESQDWAQMLLRMLQRWANDQNFQVQILDVLMGEEAGIKNATLTLSGPFAYGRLQSEAGVHRLVRISPFDSNSRRHTSFTSIFVTPEVDDDFEVTINPADLRVDVYRSGGKGGQGVNTTDSAVRLTHHPSGLVVVCQQERSQIKNKDLAMKVLRSRLYERHLDEQRQKRSQVEAGKKDIGFGSQIRSYVLHPYRMVKDHRTGHVVSTAEKTLDGDLEGFMKAYLNCRLSGNWDRGAPELPEPDALN